MQERGERRLILGLMVGVAMHAFHATAVVTVLPAIARQQGRIDLYGAVISAYLLASIVGLVAASNLMEQRGAARTFAIGIGSMTAGVLLSASATGMGWLVAARGIEGVGGGIVSNVLYASVNLGFRDEQRSRILALLSASWVVPGLAAPPLAAGIAEALGWRWVFLCVLPALLAAWWLARRPLQRLAPSSPRAAASLRIRHALGLAAGCALLFAGLEDPLSLSGALLVVAGVALVPRCLAAVLPAGTLRARPGLASAILTKTGLALAFFGTESFLPLAATKLLGWSILAGGLLLSASAVSWTLGSFAEAHLRSRFLDGRGAAALLVVGIATTWLAILAGLGPGWVTGCWIIASFGMGVGYNAANAGAMGLTPPGDEGSTSSALGVSDAFGIGLGAGLGGALIALGDAGGLPLDTALSLQVGAMIAVAGLTIVAAGRITPKAPAEDAAHVLETNPPAGEPPVARISGLNPESPIGPS